MGVSRRCQVGFTHGRRVCDPLTVGMPVLSLTTWRSCEAAMSTSGQLPFTPPAGWQSGLPVSRGTQSSLATTAYRFRPQGHRPSPPRHIRGWEEASMEIGYTSMTAPRSGDRTRFKWARLSAFCPQNAV